MVRGPLRCLSGWWSEAMVIPCPLRMRLCAGWGWMASEAKSPLGWGSHNLSPLSSLLQGPPLCHTHTCPLQEYVPFLGPHNPMCSIGHIVPYTGLSLALSPMLSPVLCAIAWINVLKKNWWTGEMG